MMETIKLSEVGGLNSTLLARMNGGIAVLTSNKIPRIVVLPYAISEQTAIETAKEYIERGTIVYDATKWPRRARLKDSTIALLNEHYILLVCKRKYIVAVLLPVVGSLLIREARAKLYLQTLGYEHISLPTL